MQVEKLNFSTAATELCFDARFADLKTFVDPKNAVLITDEHILALHAKAFKGWKVLTIKTGEEHKIQATVDALHQQLISAGCDRSTTLIGVGGGVVTDLTGYVAATFLRGVRHCFVPTTLLGMVDAAIGGKNGVDVGQYKNMVGTIKQPHLILFDVALLQTLPQREWSNGFAEVVKHAAIGNKKMFFQLQEADLSAYQKNVPALTELVMQNALYKARLVQQDEFEQGQRRLLNFGHTIGHAIEQPYGLMHGEAVAIGMVGEARLSEQLAGFTQINLLQQTLEQYGLPTALEWNKKEMLQKIKGDKKRIGAAIHLVLLKRLGEAVQQQVPLKELEELI